MNFEFVKNIEGMNKIYEYCNNAEELAVSMPYLSECASRKSAETIARYVYQIAHTNEVEDLDFFGILNDPVVRKFVRSRSVFDAFHFIRKHGNEAVHTDYDVSSEEAVDVLEDLHFVVGEIAVIMGMILDYPSFDSKSIENTGATELLDMDSTAVANEMYEEYIIFKHKIERLKAKYQELCSNYIVAPGNVDLVEVLEFTERPKLENTLLHVQEYFGSIGNMGIENEIEHSVDKKAEMTVKMRLSIKGKETYTTDDLICATAGILYDLDDADSFIIASSYSGESFAPWFDVEHQNRPSFENMDVIDKNINSTDSKELESLITKSVILDSPLPGIDRNEKFSYKRFEMAYQHGEAYCCKYEDGKWIDLSEVYSEKIIKKNYGENWWTWGVSLIIRFDCNEYASIIEQLHELVKKYIPEEELEYCINNWEGEEPENEILLDGIQWCPRSLGEIQEFLDRVNQCIDPIKDACEILTEGKWFVFNNVMAVAEIQVVDGIIKIMGTEL